MDVVVPPEDEPTKSRRRRVVASYLVRVTLRANAADEAEVPPPNTMLAEDIAKAVQHHYDFDASQVRVSAERTDR